MGCMGCGACCHKMLTDVGRFNNVPEEMTFTLGGVRYMQQRADETCVALDLDTMLCTIYEDRPATCRKFKEGSIKCLGIKAKLAQAG
jgi:Fe-S-cluster containining protein